MNVILFCIVEIDRTLKKVTEGLEIFHETLDKLNTATNPSMKEKVEGDLKKEIKKLQRLRDLIKNWQLMSEIKDKQVLNDARRSIEVEMERFKVLEKEMKIKAFSKEGLSKAAILDPREKERLDLAQWINTCVDGLRTQIDAFEAEIEALQIASKKTKKLEPAKQSRYDELMKRDQKHKWHVRKLERILRLFENERLTIEDINGIKESIDYYVESNHEADFIDDDDVYEDLGLDETSSESEDDFGGDDSDDDSDAPSSKPKVSEKAKATTATPLVKSPPALAKKPVLSSVPSPKPVAPVVSASSSSAAPSKPPVPVPPPIAPKVSGPSFASAALAALGTPPATSATETKTTTISSTFQPTGHPVTSDKSAEKQDDVDSIFMDLSSFLKKKLAESRDPMKLNNAVSLSYQYIPEEPDFFKLRTPMPNSATSPGDLPKHPPPIMENPSFFEKLDLDTLFFIFYYQQKTYAQ